MQPTNPNNKTRPYTCPKCNGQLWLKTDFTGYDIETIGMTKGKTGQTLTTERTVVTDETLTCSAINCDWVAPCLDFEEED